MQQQQNLFSAHITKTVKVFGTLLQSEGEKKKKILKYNLLPKHRRFSHAPHAHTKKSKTSQQWQ